MRVLLTGATGFIGSHVARVLVRQGFDVYATIRPRSDTRRIEDVMPSMNILHCDLFSTLELDRCLEEVRPDLVIHFAWYAEPGKYLNALENVQFVTMSLHLATKLASLGCKRLIMAGTCFEYDTSLGYLSEDSPTMPDSLYAASKLGVFLTLEQLSKVSEMSFAWLRFFYLYGPFEDERRLVPSVICSLLRNQVANLTEGKQVRDFLHIEDAAEAACAVIQSDLSGPVNIASGVPVEVRYIARKIGAILNRPDLVAIGALPSSPSDPAIVCANSGRLAADTDWRAGYDIDQGLFHTVKWWQSHIKGRKDQV